MLRAPRVSLLTLCPLAQPEKAIGHESQIEPWLALTTPLLDASETDERRYASKMNLENRKNRGSSHQYMAGCQEEFLCAFQSREKFFSLTFLFIEQCYRPLRKLLIQTRLAFWRGTTIWSGSLARNLAKNCCTADYKGLCEVTPTNGHPPVMSLTPSRFCW